LGKRQFVLKKAGSDTPALTTTRWAMSYLRGPLMKGEISLLAESGLVAKETEVSAVVAEPASAASVIETTGAPTVAAESTVLTPAADLADDETPVSPAVAPGIPVSYLDPAAPWARQIGAAPGPHVRPAVVARVLLRFDDTKADLMHDEEYEAVLYPITPLPNPTDFIAVDYDDRDLRDEPPGSLAYGLVKAEIGRKTWWTTLQKSLTDQLVRTKSVEILVNTDLKAFSRVGETPEQFAARCTEIAGSKADAEIAALQKKYDTKLRALKIRFDAAAAASQQASARHEAEYGTAAQVGTLLGGLFGGRRSRTSITSEIKRSATSQTRVDAAYGKASTAQQAIIDLEAELQGEVAGIDATWTALAGSVEIMSIPLEKTDVAVTDLRLVWVPVS
jgi:hypothetical protein